MFDISKYSPAAIIIACFVFIAKQFWDIISSERRNLTEALHQTTMAISRLTIKIEMIEKRLEGIPEIRKDLDALGKKVRDTIQPRI